MATMRVAQVPQPNGPLELVEREIPQPSAGQVRIKVQACGVCHSDSVTKQGLFPNIQYPRVPGHEVIGSVDAIGSGVAGWSAGQRVGVGWHGGNCGYCDACRRGDAFACETETLMTGVTSDGGYAEYMIAPATALARVPDDLSSVEAAPLMCAGITTFNALRNSGARPGEVVAVLGIGGLGHLGVQFAAKMGFKTIAIARGQDKAPLARQLGAHHYIDSRAEDPAAAAEIRRRQGDPRHGDERRGDGCRAGRPRGEGNIVDRWRAGVAQHRPAVVDLWQPLDHGLVLWNLDRLTADARIQRIDRRALDERGLSAGARGGGL